MRGSDVIGRYAAGGVAVGREAVRADLSFWDTGARRAGMSEVTTGRLPPPRLAG